jgi:hypothetical protein
MSQLYPAMGTAAAPADLGAAEVVESSVSVGPSDYSYISVAVEIDKNYLVQVSHAPSAVSLQAMTGDFEGSLTTLCSYTSLSDYGLGQCLTGTMSTDTLLLRASDSSSRVGGQQFDVSIIEAPVNEGTAISPVDLGSTIPLRNYQGQVGADGDSFYQITIMPNTEYFFSLNGGYYRDMTVYSDSEFTTAIDCYQSYDNACRWTSTAQQSVAYIKVSDRRTGNTATGDFFELNVTDTLPDHQSSSNQPQELAAAPFDEPLQMEIGRLCCSYLAVPVQANTAYQINIDGFSLAMEVDLKTGSGYINSGWDNCARERSGGNVVCEVVTGPSDTFLYLRVEHYNKWVGTYFYLDVQEK